ncbi:hypothetical protein EC973_005759 [Apophysomyces ossiformis]|uniref:Vacuolar protein 14 C-terminal Fig4-binding domain-containing protein n=1 Tax=Apophysomyces ossiformis TaxID=679940 RepID=A0A8H7EKX6_9FUNG|nr:hypothetical protein EC973_005759 [Apophysomyces ossiformis]
MPLIRGLTDKNYDRRKTAALEIERMVRQNDEDHDKITAIIDALVQDFVYSNSPTARYGGLIGLAASAIALGPGVVDYLDIIVPPILSCFSNQDQKVRYYACESMYNIAKVAKGEVLRFFNSIFDALCKLSADSDITVKNGAELLDRLIKDIVSELATTYISPHQPPLNTAESNEPLVIPTSLPRNTAFSLPRFIPLLSQRIYVLNSSARQFLVSWIGVLDSIPDLELVSFLPEFLDGLLQCLSDPSDDVRVATNVLLADFFEVIQQAAAVREQQQQQQQQQQQLESAKPKESQTVGEDEDTKADSTSQSSTVVENEGQGKGSYLPGQGVIVQYGRIVEILLPHLSSPEEDIQRTALQWINGFIAIAKDVIIEYTPKIIKAVLPTLAHPVNTIRMFALETNRNLQQLVFGTSQPEPMISVSDPLGRTVKTMDRQVVHQSNEQEPEPEPFDYQATAANLRLQFLDEHEETRVASLEWLLMLHKKAPNKIFVSDDGTFPALLKTLSDPSEEVVRRDLQLLAQISLYSDREYFENFMTHLLSLFSTDRPLLESRGSLIVRQLCMSLHPERIYCTMAKILEKEKDDLEFASIMVQHLNIILITSSELSDLRKRLRNLDQKDNQRLFTTLYMSWCHNAVATFSLCLLAQAYEHASNLLQCRLGNHGEYVGPSRQTRPIARITDLRLQLLEPEKYPYLYKCLYGILMLLPQSSAFSTLRNRLSSVSSLGFLHVLPKRTPSTPFGTEASKQPQSQQLPLHQQSQQQQRILKASNGSNKGEENIIKFHELLQHLKKVQSRHEDQRKQGLTIGSGMSNPMDDNTGARRGSVDRTISKPTNQSPRLVAARRVARKI